MKDKQFLYQFVGGEYNGKLWHYAALEARNIIKGFTEDLTEQRKTARYTMRREELDNQPIIDGYLTPMYDGERYEVNGKLKYAFKCTEAEKTGKEPIHIIRYETEEVYDMMSN